MKVNSHPRSDNPIRSLPSLYLLRLKKLLNAVHSGLTTQQARDVVATPQAHPLAPLGPHHGCSHVA